MRFSVDLELIQDRSIRDIDVLVYSVADSLSQNGHFKINFDSFTHLINRSKQLVNGALERLAQSGYIKYQVTESGQLGIVLISAEHQFQVKAENERILAEKHKQEEARKNESRKDQIEIAKYVIEYMNTVTGRHLRTSTKSYQDLIIALLNKNYTKDDLLTAITKMKEAWKGTKWFGYIRPETIFNPNKFDGYLNWVQRKEPARMDKYDENKPKDGNMEGW